MSTSPLHLNADLGERGPEHPGDIALLTEVDAINLACGGHAGDAATIADLSARARAHGVEVIAHPSYPDRANFGRRSLNLPWSELAASLAEQWAAVPGAAGVKWHGALYTDAAADPELAARLADWLSERSIALALAPPDSAMAAALAARGIACRREGFADRRYHRRHDHAALLPRSTPGAVIASVAEAVAQVASVQEHGLLPLADGDQLPFACDTWCIHSDGPHATALARALRQGLTC